MYRGNIARLQLIVCLFIVFLPLEITIVEIVAECQLTKSIICLAENRLTTIYRGQGISKLRSDNIATRGFLHLDIYNIRDILSIADTRIVDKLNMINTQHIERLQILL